MGCGLMRNIGQQGTGEGGARFCIIGFQASYARSWRTLRLLATTMLAITQAAHYHTKSSAPGRMNDSQVFVLRIV